MEPYSVLMSVYDKENADYLKKSLESMLKQTFPPGDFVLICDGPLTPELDAVIDAFFKKYPGLFQVIHLPENQGLGKALNVGLSVCKYDLVARMDSDDISDTERCRRQVQAFEESPELTVVSGTVVEFEGSPEFPVAVKRLPEQHDEILRYAKLRNPFNHPAVMYRKSVVLRVGGYQDAPLHEDYDLWVRILMQGSQTRNLPWVLCYMRVDNGMYKRRGGIKYLKIISKFHRKLYQEKFCTWGQYMASVAVYTASCLVPTWIRCCFYQKILRKT